MSGRVSVVLMTGIFQVFNSLAIFAEYMWPINASGFQFFSFLISSGSFLHSLKNHSLEECGYSSIPCMHALQYPISKFIKSATFIIFRIFV